jgi:hypothetical protein
MSWRACSLRKAVCSPASGEQTGRSRLSGNFQGARSLREELGIESEGPKEIFTHTHSYAGFSTVKLKFFHVPRYGGQMVNRVFEQICWVTTAELAALNFLEGDRPVVEWLMSGNASTLWQGLEL